MIFFAKIIRKIFFYVYALFIPIGIKKTKVHFLTKAHLPHNQNSSILSNKTYFIPQKEATYRQAMQTILPASFSNAKLIIKRLIAIDYMQRKSKNHQRRF